MKSLVIFLILFSTTVNVYAGNINEKEMTTKCDDKNELKEDSNFFKKITSYEPNRVGWTWDDDDVGYMDFTVSLKYPIFNERLKGWGKNYRLVPNELYFAFTGRFGQYIGTRDSSPVIGKRYNPKLIFQYQLGDSKIFSNNRINIAYAHESNGQSISTLNEYIEKQSSVKDPLYANDYITRGWDYVEVEWKGNVFEEFKKRECDEECAKKRDEECVEQCDEEYLNVYLDFKYFLSHGLLQKRAEEYYDWENDVEGKKRNGVNGVMFITKYKNDSFSFSFFECIPFIERFKTALIYETGYRNPFKYNTIKIEIGTYVTFPVIKVPLSIWWSHGYNSDLAMYYKKVTSYGLTIEIGSF